MYLWMRCLNTIFKDIHTCSDYGFLISHLNWLTIEAYWQELGHTGFYSWLQIPSIYYETKIQGGSFIGLPQVNYQNIYDFMALSILNLRISCNKSGTCRNPKWLFP